VQWTKKKQAYADSDHDSAGGTTSSKKRDPQQGNSNKTRKARRTKHFKSGTRKGAINVLFKDQNEHEDNSENDDGEQDSPPANTNEDWV
jgi:hypothetical protein